MIIIYLIVGVILGIVLGWALLFLLMDRVFEQKKPPAKDEWKVM